jgi:hypothetical protein
MKFGLQAERWMEEILDRAGYEVRHATWREDRIFKVDFWVRLDDYWIPIQFSLDKKAIVSWKGRDAIRKGIVPMWMDGKELLVAVENGNGAGLVKEFWTRVEKILAAFPVKRFREPHWTCALTER